MLKRRPSGATPAPNLRWIRPVLCLGCAALVVAVIAGFWPRAFFASDDAAIVRHLRQDTLAPFISPVLSQVLSLGYRWIPDAPWFGFYLYAVHAFSLAVLWWLILECGSIYRAARALRAVILVAATLGFAAAIHRLTFSSVSILACSIALIGWVVEARTQSRRGGRERMLVASVLGALLALGLAARTMGLAGAFAAVAPLLAWHAWRLFRSKRAPRLVVVALLAGPPSALILLGGLMPQTWDPVVRDYEAFNQERGAIHGMAAFIGIHRRAPELLEQAGWTRREWLDFRAWLFLDERIYTTDKVRRLRETGGRPREIGDAATRARQVIVSSYEGQNHSIRFLAFVFAACGLVAVICASQYLLAFVLLGSWVGYLYALITWLLVYQRFPDRVSAAVYIATAIAIAALIVTHFVDRRPGLRGGRWVAAILLAVLSAVTGVNWVRDLGRFDPRTDLDYEIPAFEARLARRYQNGAVIVKDASVRLSVDPLAAPPHYEVVPLGWDTFSAPFYNELKRLGVNRGSELIPALVDNPKGYILIHRRRVRRVSRYIRRRVPDIHLQRVDAPETPRPFALYRVVSDAVRQRSAP